MRWIGTASGLLATAAGVAVLLAPQPVPPVNSTAATNVPSPSAVVSSTAVSSEPQTPRDLPGLDPRIASVLADTGYASYATDQDVQQLGPEVVRTLIANGAVLVIPEEPSTNAFGGM